MHLLEFYNLSRLPSAGFTCIEFFKQVGHWAGLKFIKKMSHEFQNQMKCVHDQRMWEYWKGRVLHIHVHVHVRLLELSMSFLYYIIKFQTSEELLEYSALKLFFPHLGLWWLCSLGYYIDIFYFLQQTTIPKAVNSLKVLAELPIIVVLMYQVRFH